MSCDIPRSVELAFLEEPPAKLTGCKCKLCGDDIAVDEDIVEIDDNTYHYDCLDVDALLDIMGATVKEAEIIA